MSGEYGQLRGCDIVKGQKNFQRYRRLAKLESLWSPCNRIPPESWETLESYQILGTFEIFPEEDVKAWDRFFGLKCPMNLIL